jgi:hypothetical protein
MKKKHMTLKEFFAFTRIPKSVIARDAGLSPSVICDLAKGKHLPTLRIANAIEKATGGVVTLYDWIIESEYEKE